MKQILPFVLIFAAQFAHADFHADVGRCLVKLGSIGTVTAHRPFEIDKKITKGTPVILKNAVRSNMKELTLRDGSQIYSNELFSFSAVAVQPNEFQIKALPVYLRGGGWIAHEEGPITLKGDRFFQYYSKKHEALILIATSKT